MSDVIFVKTRYQDVGYKSYVDFWRLVELAGYPTIYVDELDPQSDNTYIVTPLNGEWMQGWQQPRARIIHYELEWRAATDWRATAAIPPGVAEVWHFDKWMAERIGAKYVPIGSDARLNIGKGVETTPGYDLAFMAYMVPRRQHMAHLLSTRGLTLSPPSAWDFDRAVILNSSRAYLHVHQWDAMPGVPALRMVVAAAYGLPVISETVADPGIFKTAALFLSSYEHLADFTALWLSDRRNDARMADAGRALHSLLCEQWTFRKSIEAAL